jgi:UDP-N-acetylmuramyl pentapeptide synthase
MHVPATDAVAAIEEYVPSNNRSQLTKTERNSLVVDAYNANPTSMKAAIENFAQLNMPSKVLVLGDMLELGKDSLMEHIGVVKLAADKGFEQIYLVGGEFAGDASGIPALSLVLGFASAFLSGLFACTLMVNIVKRAKLWLFAVYCVIVGIACIVSSII